LGIHFSPGEDTLYVCDSGYGGNIGRLRRIVMNSPVNKTPSLSSHSIAVYPNPAQKVLFIEIPNGQMEAVTIHDASGKLVLNFSENTSESVIDISNFLPGTYFIRVYFQDEVFLKKLVKY